jgi:hypothetical protein
MHRAAVAIDKGAGIKHKSQQGRQERQSTQLGTSLVRDYESDCNEEPSAWQLHKRKYSVGNLRAHVALPISFVQQNISVRSDENALYQQV